MKTKKNKYLTGNSQKVNLINDEISDEKKQVFFSESQMRWKWFKNVFRVLVLIFLLSVFALGFEIFSSTSTLLPRIHDKNDGLKKLPNPDKVTSLKAKQNLELRRLKMRLENTSHFSYLKRFHIYPFHHRSIPAQIRAGFFVNWDLQSFYSLRNNIDKMNLIIPEWLFVPDNADTVVSDINLRALSIMKKHNISIMPMLTNYFNGQFNGDNVHRIIATKTSRIKFISSILNILKKYSFNGVNIDFENLIEKGDEKLIEFQDELYKTLHKEGYLVTEDIPPFNSDYNISQLKDYNDFLIIMAYDYHYAGSEPGPVAPVKWVESALASFLKKTDPSKIILAIPAYGYDWAQGEEGQDITYQEAMVTAKESEGNIDFDDDNYNLYFKYYDDDDVPHDVWFTDAGTCFNLMRSAADFQTAGVALWRLGDEDPRIWRFYKRDFSELSFFNDPFDLKMLTKSPPSKNLDYEGEGEIIDIVALPDSGTIKVEYNYKDNLITEQNYVKLPTSFVIKKFGEADKTVVLTFDDGPSSEYTPEILKILKAEKVPASFFVVGINAENNLGLLKEIYDDGYEIGNHTFTHPNLAEENTAVVDFELNATRKLIETMTGHSTILFRPPYNADAEPETMDEIIPIIEAKTYNYYTVTESIDPRDWEEGVTVDSIMARVIREQDYGSIILLHDAGGDRSATVKALPEIIRYFKNKGYKFSTVAGLLGKNRNYVMPPLKNTKDIYFSQVNWWIVEFVYWVERIVFALFFVGIVLAVGRTLIITILASYDKRKEKDSPTPLGMKGKVLPSVSILIPAFNEEVTAIKTINNLLKSDYPDFEIIFVDDGSSDNTYNLVEKEFSSNSVQTEIKNKVKIYTKPNGGKASALNYGLNESNGEIVVCIDADTQLKSDAILELIKNFDDEKVAAVAGNVKVGNKNNFLTKWQSIEYITSQNFDRRAFDIINCITVVPGAIGAFRRTALLEVGGFMQDTLAEDCDVTLHLLKAGYRVKNSISAIAYTEVPETIKMFLRQRFRWSFGIMQSVWKHKEALFRPNYKNFGMIALPHAFLFQFIMPVVAPFADLLMLYSIVAGFWQQTIPYYVLFAVIDIASAILAFSFEKENYKDLWLLIPQRFIYRQLMYFILYKSILTAIKGKLVGWGVLRRTGTVKLAES